MVHDDDLMSIHTESILRCTGHPPSLDYQGTDNSHRPVVLITIDPICDGYVAV
jgi:hypothetical protein